ncbi:MAG: 4-diphosphocytidyl-2C-methyl-D-erythritol kinase, partial [Acetobacteraceae bacterium]
MIFRALPLAEAKGAILAHSIPLPGCVLSKGSVLSEEVVTALAAAGRESVLAGRLEAGEVPEDAAADRLAAALLAPLIGRSHAATGRVNLYAEVPGLLRVNRTTVDRMNRLDESVTLATLADYAVVAAKEMIATIKIIPFAVTAATLAVTEALARQEKPALILHPFRSYRVGLVTTELAGMPHGMAQQTIAASDARVTALTGTLLPPLSAQHAAEPIADALKALISQGAEILLVVGASGVVDRRDVAPEGIIRAGGHIIRLGMPVDPGNLICIGAIGEKPALVLPGCAHSTMRSGIDLILPRLFAGLPVGSAEVATMGVGGLLPDIEARPMPRAEAPAAPRIGAAPRARP